MKKMIRDNSKNLIDEIFGMAHLTPKRTGLSANIWSDHKGISRKVPHSNTPRIKIDSGDYEVSVTIEEEPQIEARDTNKPKKSDENHVKEAMKYVGRNYDLFLKHYKDTDDSFDDEDLFNALRRRGEYR